MEFGYKEVKMIEKVVLLFEDFDFDVEMELVIIGVCVCVGLGDFVVVVFGEFDVFVNLDYLMVDFEIGVVYVCGYNV